MYGARRERFLEAIGPGVAVIPSAPVAIRNNDVEFPYRQDSDFFYLTGFDEPHSLLVLTNRHADHRALLFLRPRDPERETWDGPRVGVERAPAELGVDAAFPIAELRQRLPVYLQNVGRMHYRVGRDRGLDDTVFGVLDHLRSRARHGITWPQEIVDPALTLHEMRLRKEPAELDAMRKAVHVTREAHLAAMEVAMPGVYEYEVEAELLRVFRAHGSQRPAYECIVGSGPNATILHYRRNDRRMQKDELLLIDAGSEVGYYASDVTRTFPVSGRFTAEQRAVYDVVLDAQKAAIDAVRPGATVEEVHQAGLEVIVRGMLDLKLVSGTRDEVMENGEYRKFFMHRTSHWLGMDVHDVGGYFQDGKARPMEPGFVLTVEPGIYIAPDAEVDPRFRGIGIRIEDDVLVTPQGRENLTQSIPKDPADLEQLLTGRAAAPPTD